MGLLAKSSKWRKGTPSGWGTSGFAMIKFLTKGPVAAIGFLVVLTGPAAAELLLFGGRGHDVFLGCLQCSHYDSASICNKYGMGSKYEPNGIFNRYGTYGSKYQSTSPWNKYASGTDVPVLVDRDGGFYGYFTTNHYRFDAVSFADDLGDIFDATDGDLESVRDILCQTF